MGNESSSVAETRLLKEPLVHESVAQSTYDTTRTMEQHSAYFQHSMLLDSSGNLSQDLQEALLEVFSKYSSGLVMTQAQVCGMIKECYPHIKKKEEEVVDRAEYLLEKYGMLFGDFKQYLQQVLSAPTREELIENSASNGSEDNDYDKDKDKNKTMDKNKKTNKKPTDEEDDHSNGNNNNTNHQNESSVESHKKYRITHEPEPSFETSTWKILDNEIKEGSISSEHDKTATTTITASTVATATGTSYRSNETQVESKEESNWKHAKNDREILKYTIIWTLEEKDIIDTTLDLAHIRDTDRVLTKTQFLSYYRKACIDKPVMVRLELVAFGFPRFNNTVPLDSSKTLDILAHKVQQERNQYDIHLTEINRIQSAKSSEDCALSIQNFVQSHSDPLDNNNTQNLFRRAKPTSLNFCC